MAGNNAIQFLRGTQAKIDASTQAALAGQPVYATDTHYLYVGDGSTQIKSLPAVKASYADTADDAKKVNGLNIRKDSDGNLGYRSNIGNITVINKYPYLIEVETDFDVYVGMKLYLFGDEATVAQVNDTTCNIRWSNPDSKWSSATGTLPCSTLVSNAANAERVNYLEIKRDSNGVLKIGDIIIPQKKIIWSGEKLISSNNSKVTVYLSDIKFSESGGKILEIEFSINASGLREANDIIFAKMKPQLSIYHEDNVIYYNPISKCTVSAMWYGTSGNESLVIVFIRSGESKPNVAVYSVSEIIE